MRRRQVLAAVPVALSAGCLGRSDGYGSDGGGGVVHEQTALEITDVGCGTATETASVSFDSAHQRVSVTGTTSAPDACYRARVGSATYDGETDEFELVVEAFDAKEGVCTECITEIDYETTSDFDGGLPGTVVVVHDSRGKRREVATASP